MIAMPVTLKRRTASAHRAWGILSMALVLGASQAHAGPFKQNMQRMNQTTKAAKAELGAFDPGSAAALLKDYVEEAREGQSLSGGSSAKAQDLSARFARLASTAQNGAGAAATQAQFRKAFSDIVTQCKSCHAAYK